MELNKPVLMFQDECLVYSGDTWTQFKEDIVNIVDFDLCKIGKEGDIVLYLSENRKLIIKFKSFKVLMTTGIKVLGLKFD
jgi:hypothetical protein